MFSKLRASLSLGYSLTLTHSGGWVPGGGQTSLWDGEGVPSMSRGSCDPVTCSGKTLPTELSQALGL